jgi:hypothetical protein
MKKLIMSAVLVAAMFGFNGCDGVDSQRLALLTGDKSFEQVQAAYKLSVLNEKPEDSKIYAYYLEKNQDKVAGFNFENFSLKVENDYVKVKKELDDKLKKIRENLDKVTITQLKSEMTMYAFMMGQAKPIDDYVKALEQLQKDKWVMIDAKKKAEKQADEERYINSLSPEQREQYLKRKEFEAKIQAKRDAAAATKQNNNGEIK